MEERIDSLKAHSNTVSVALFAPFDKRKSHLEEGQVIITGDLSGEIKVFENKVLNNGRAATLKSKHSDKQPQISTPKPRSVSN